GLARGRPAGPRADLRRARRPGFGEALHVIDDWPATPDEAIELQLRMAPLVDPHPPAGFAPRTAAGLDVAYDEKSDRLFAAVGVLDIASLETVAEAVVPGVTDFPYVPGLFAFRELPALLTALERLTVSPDL